MRRGSSLRWTSADADDDGTPGPAQAWGLPAMVPPHDWAALLGPVREGLARVARSPVVRGDLRAREVLTALANDPDQETLDAVLDALSARLDDLVKMRAANHPMRAPTLALRGDEPALRASEPAPARETRRRTLLRL